MIALLLLLTAAYADDFALLGYTLALPGPPCPVPANCYPAT